VGIVGVSAFEISSGDARSSRSAPILPVPTTTITKQVLRDEVRAPCTPQVPTTEVLSPPVPRGTPLVVTAIGVRAGEEVRTGRLLAVVSGVPVFAFVTRIPFYRNLTIGDTGPDVLALEQALVAAGKLSVATTVFDSETAGALNSIYSQARVQVAGIIDHLLLRSSKAVPTGSQVSEVDAAVGQVVTSSAPLMVLSGAASKLSCRVPDSSQVSVGERLKLDSSPSLQVVVRSIDADTDPSSTVRAVIVAPVMARAPIASADLLISAHVTRTAVLTVPADAIWTGANGSFIVRKVVGETVTPIVVHVGQAAGGYVEVSGSGLAAGEVVQLHSAVDERIKSLS
jgi:hypothetical protein